MEVIEFRIKHEFSSFNTNESTFRKIVDDTIVKHLEQKGVPVELDGLIDLCIKLNQQQLLQQYMSALLELKWPKQTTHNYFTSGHELLKFICQWRFDIFIRRQLSQLEQILAPSWLTIVFNSMKYLVEVVGAVIAGTEKLCVIKLFQQYETNLGKFSSLFSKL